MSRQIDIDVFQIVRARASYSDFFGREFRRSYGLRSSGRAVLRIKRATCYYSYKLIRGLVPSAFCTERLAAIPSIPT